jgi:hypothetical protein
LHKALALLLILLTAAAIPAERKPHFDVVIYGGGPQAVATALKISDTEPRANILMIVPERALGSIMTLGKQNIFDVNRFRPSRLPEGIPDAYKGSQAGTFFYFVSDLSTVFPPQHFETYLKNKIGRKKKHPGAVRRRYCGRTRQAGQAERNIRRDRNVRRVRPACDSPTCAGLPAKCRTAVSNLRRGYSENGQGPSRKRHI